MRIIVLLFSLISITAFGQDKQKGDGESALLIGLSYKGAMPGADFADRWGFNNTLGIDGNFKFKNNVTVGLNGGFIFGNRFKDTTTFANLYNEHGNITSLSTGKPADVKFLMRGFNTYASVGYVWNRFGSNANSGIWFDFGVGFSAHKIKIESLYDAIPQLEGDYRKGYDKLTMGVSSRQFIGYLYQAEKRLFRVYAGIEFSESFTNNVRSYNFDIGGPDNTLYNEFNYGFKVGWIVPIKKRTSNGYYTD